MRMVFPSVTVVRELLVTGFMVVLLQTLLVTLLVIIRMLVMLQLPRLLLLLLLRLLSLLLLLLPLLLRLRVLLRRCCLECRRLPLLLQSWLLREVVPLRVGIPDGRRP